MINVFGNRHVKEDFAENLEETINSGWIGCGPKVNLFESEFSKKIQKPFVMTNNGSNALHMAVKLLHLPKNSKIILPSFTFVACVQAILLEGHIPVFCDVELDGNVSLRTIEEVLSPEVKAIMVVHYAGRPVNMKEILGLNIPIIEDVAHAADSSIDGQPCGSFGVINAFSFDPIKNLATPDAGGISLDGSLVDEAKRLRNLSIASTGFSSKDKFVWWNEEVSDVFPKYLPNDIAAVFALEQLKNLDKNQEKRKKIWDTYQEAFSGLEWLEIESEIPQNMKHSYFTYLIKIQNRDKFANYLKENGVYTTLRFQPLHYIGLYSEYVSRWLLGCEILNATGLNLPLHPRLTETDVDKIIDLVKKWGQKNY